VSAESSKGVKLHLEGKYTTPVGDFNFKVDVEGKKAVELWDLIFKQTTTDKGLLDITEAGSAEEAEEEEASPETEMKVDELLSVAKEIIGGKTEEAGESES